MGMITRLFLGALALAACYPALADSFHTFDDIGRLGSVNGDPSSFQVEQWIACYYKLGMTVTTRFACSGMELGNTSAEVINKVKRAQNFEREYTRWCRCPWDMDSAFNVIVPIAQLKKEEIALSHQQRALIQMLGEAREKLGKLMGAYTEVAELNGDDRYAVPHGAVLEFMRQMHETIKQSLSVAEKVSNYADLGLVSLNYELNKFSSSVSRASDAYPAAIASMSTNEKLLANWTVGDSQYSITNGVVTKKSLSFISDPAPDSAGYRTECTTDSCTAYISMHHRHSNTALVEESFRMSDVTAKIADPRTHLVDVTCKTATTCIGGASRHEDKIAFTTQGQAATFVRTVNVRKLARAPSDSVNLGRDENLVLNEKELNKIMEALDRKFQECASRRKDCNFFGGLSETEIKKVTEALDKKIKDCTPQQKDCDLVWRLGVAQ